MLEIYALNRWTDIHKKVMVCVMKPVKRLLHCKIVTSFCCDSPFEYFIWLKKYNSIFIK